MKKIVAGMLLFGIVAAFGWQRFSRQQAPSITTFEECAKAYPVGESYPRQCWTPEGGHFVETVGEPAMPGPVTVSGEITCLPKVGSGAQTLECAIGLLADNGRYYGLRHDDPQHQLSQGGSRVEVTGELSAEEMTGPDGNRYDIAGIIDVSSYEFLPSGTQ